MLHGAFGDHAHHFIFQRFDEPASEDNDLRVKKVDHVGDGDSDVLRRFGDDPINEFVAAANGLAQIATAQIIETGAEHLRKHGFLTILNRGMNMLEDCSAAGQGFETAVVSAGAFGSVDVNDHVPDLASSPIKAGMELTIQDETSANACADENANQIA